MHSNSISMGERFLVGPRDLDESVDETSYEDYERETKPTDEDFAGDSQ